MDELACSKCGLTSSTLIECQQDESIFCIDCAQEHVEHALRYVVRCQDCKEKVGHYTCDTCLSNADSYPVCAQCQNESHPTRRQLRKLKSEVSSDDAHDVKKRPWGSRTMRAEAFDGTYCIGTTMPDRQKLASTTEGDSATSQEHLSRIKDKIAKMLRLAGNPGTNQEGSHAGRVAAEWMSKYQLSKYDMAVKGEMVGGDYRIHLRSTAPNRIKAARAFGSACETWVRQLTSRVASVFPQFVEWYESNNYQTYKKCFLGVEDAAWSAAELLCELIDIVCKYTRVMVLSGRFKTALAIESYANGMVDGLNVKSFADLPELLKGMSDADKNKMAVISGAGMQVVQRMRSKHNFTNIKEKNRRMDWDAYYKGKDDGRGAHDRGSKRLRIEM